MDDLGINISRIDLRDGRNLRLIHDDGIALHVGVTESVSYRNRMEGLHRSPLGNRTGNDPGRAARAV